MVSCFKFDDQLYGKYNTNLEQQESSYPFAIRKSVATGIQIYSFKVGAFYIDLGIRFQVITF
jgi:predicted sugar kinase